MSDSQALGFKRAVKYDARLRMALCGPSGSGKSFTSLRIATELAGTGKIAAVDTERGSLSKYADLFNFDVVEFTSYDPLKLIEVVKSAEAENYTVFIIDSLSHFWFGKDGELEKVDQAAKRSQSKNSWAAWKEVTPIHNRLVETLLGSRMHLICTMRTKTEWVLEEVVTNGQKKTVPRKIGLAPIMRDGIEFEFDVCGDMDHDNTFIVSKSRCPQLVETGGGVYAKPGKDMAAILREWLTGTPVAQPNPAPVVIAMPSAEGSPVDAMLARMTDPYKALDEFARMKKDLIALDGEQGEMDYYQYLAMGGEAEGLKIEKSNQFKNLGQAKRAAKLMQEAILKRTTDRVAEPLNALAGGA